MDIPTRFTAKRDGVDGAVVKDNKTGRIVAVFPADPDIQGMAERFARAAADEFNRLNREKVRSRRGMGRGQ